MSESTANPGYDSPVTPAAISSARRYLRVWERSRVVWAIGIGLFCVIATSIGGAVRLAIYDNDTTTCFYCVEPLYSGAFRSHWLASGLELCGEDPQYPNTLESFERSSYLRAPDTAALRAAGAEITHSQIDRVLSKPDWVWYYKVGAPFRCFVGELGLGTRANSTPRNRNIWLTHLGTKYHYVHFPYGPLPGLLYSWLFWSALAYIPLTGFSFLRIRRRMKRGWCPKCAYDLAGVPRCPECGTVVVREAPDPGAVV